MSPLKKYARILILFPVVHIAAVAVRARLDSALVGATPGLTDGQLPKVPEQVAIPSEVPGRGLRSVEVAIEHTARS